MFGCKPLSVPGRKLSETDEKHVDNVTPLDTEEHSLYRAGVGELQYMLNEYPGITFAEKCCSTGLATPTRAGMNALKWCMRYAAGTRDEWLYLTVRDGKYDPKTTLQQINVYVDRDWAGDTHTRKSTSSSFMTVDGFMLGVNVQLQETRAIVRRERVLRVGRRMRRRFLCTSDSRGDGDRLDGYSLVRCERSQVVRNEARTIQAHQAR